jgi:hypothetical protein
VGPPLGVLRHQPRLIRHLVEVLVHDVRLVDGESIYNDHRNLAGGAEAEELLALVRKVDLVDVEIYPNNISSIRNEVLRELGTMMGVNVYK